MSHWVRSFKKRKAFLDQLEAGDSVSAAARAAGGTAREFNAWRKDDPNFAKDWEEAEEAGTDFIEDVATNRALTKSDSLMAMILKARRPDKYDRGSKLELSGGISVEGSKATLLNKLARLKAQGALPQVDSEAEQNLLEGSEAVPTEPLALPAPDNVGSVKGRKRRAAAEGSRRDASA